MSDCADVTETHLSTVWGYMGLEREGLTALKAGDFEGLSGLNNLNLSNNSIYTLPEGIFDGLSSLNTLLLIYTGLDSLSEDVFDGLSALRYLRLNGNDLTELPEDIFDGLDLVELPLQYNDFSILPRDVFDGLDNLTLLGLDNNELSALPDGLFDGLESLTRLELQNNPGAPFTFTAKLEQRGDTGLAVKVAQGAPYEIEVTLSVESGTLSATTVTVDGGSNESETITVTPSGEDDVTVSVYAAAFLEGYGPSAIPELNDRLLSSGIQAGAGGNLTFPQNSAATGAPTISGTAQVGQTLTASTTGISDDDGLTDVSYNYQWLADDTDIDGATSSTYALQSSENGKVIKVRVTFTDDAGNDESLTSIGTSAVVLGGL